MRKVIIALSAMIVGTVVSAGDVFAHDSGGGGGHGGGGRGGGYDSGGRGGSESRGVGGFGGSLANGFGGGFGDRAAASSSGFGHRTGGEVIGVLGRDLSGSIGDFRSGMRSDIARRDLVGRSFRHRFARNDYECFNPELGYGGGYPCYTYDFPVAGYGYGYPYNTHDYPYSGYSGPYYNYGARLRIPRHEVASRRHQPKIMAAPTRSRHVSPTAVRGHSTGSNRAAQPS